MGCEDAPRTFPGTGWYEPPWLSVGSASGLGAPDDEAERNALGQENAVRRARGIGFIRTTNQEGTMPEATHHVHYRLIAEAPRSAPCPADWNTPVPGENGLLQLAPGLHVRASRFVWAEYHEDHAYRPDNATTPPRRA